FISGALKETFTAGAHQAHGKTQNIDAVVTHRVWGFPIFFTLMWFMFYCTFALGEYPQHWIESGVDWLYGVVHGGMTPGALRDMLADGVISGVGSVLVFLPNIMILYLFISFMEDSGYLARAAFIMDKVMHHVGVHGKSFIPLVMGFGCNVPAVMACRTIECRTSRLITIFIVPFMSCSARLPIYMMIVGSFFAAHAGTVLFMIYVGGMIVAVATARLMRRFMFREQEAPFVMELSPYRLPSLQTTFKHMWSKCSQYLRKMGGLILVASVIVWALSYYPQSVDYEHGDDAVNYEQSYIGHIGKFCQPLFEPMEFNWKASVAILSGIPAKEIVVSTMNVLYTADDDAEPVACHAEAEDTSDDEPTIRQRIGNSMSLPSAVAFLIFVLLYMPCIATVAAIGNEAGWRWAAASAVYNTGVAWVLSYAAYLITGLFV
ncbi:MAG: ferrous iron transport protein B, partial [Alistipes sp.]|nr:ferrous iron transport protein B [Alistipes sp.]